MAKVMIFHLRAKLLGYFFHKIPIFDDYSMKKHSNPRKHVQTSTSFYAHLKSDNAKRQKRKKK